jgi:hypothetical protein
VVIVLSLCMDPSSILIWNVCGLNGAARQAGVRNLIASSRIDVVCLQETKMEGLSRITVLRILSPEFCNCLLAISWGEWWHSSGLEGSLGLSWEFQD